MTMAAHKFKHCNLPFEVEPSHEYKPKRKAAWGFSSNLPCHACMGPLQAWRNAIGEARSDCSFHDRKGPLQALWSTRGEAHSDCWSFSCMRAMQAWWKTVWVSEANQFRPPFPRPYGPCTGLRILWRRGAFWVLVLHLYGRCTSLMGKSSEQAKQINSDRPSHARMGPVQASGNATGEARSYLGLGHGGVNEKRLWNL